MPLTIRAALAADERAVVELWRRCALVAPDNDPVVDFRFARGGAASDVLVGEDEGRIVASALVGHDGRRGWLCCAAAEAWLHDRRIAKVQLLVRETNTAVVSFYEHLGFEVAPRVVMSKWLERPR